MLLDLGKLWPHLIRSEGITNMRGHLAASVTDSAFYLLNNILTFFLNVSTINLLRQISLYCNWRCSTVNDKMFYSLRDYHPLDVNGSTTIPEVVTAKNVFRHCPWEMKITTGWNHWFISKGHSNEITDLIFIKEFMKEYIYSLQWYLNILLVSGHLTIILCFIAKYLEDWTHWLTSIIPALGNWI
jgi:hypothetical protein